MDKIANEAGLKYLDINVSYDLKYRYKNEQDRLLALSTINKIIKRYDYAVGVQMIVTQNVIDLVKQNQFNINDFIENEAPGCNFVFLYPHEINTGFTLSDFFFKRNDFINFILYLQQHNARVAHDTIYSTLNSGTFKYTGYYEKVYTGYDQQPILSDGKEKINPKCGHSMLYKCYSDSDACMVCDIKSLELV